MIRKIIIVLLTLGAVVTVVLWQVTHDKTILQFDSGWIGSYRYFGQVSAGQLHLGRSAREQNPATLTRRDLAGFRVVRVRNMLLLYVPLWAPLVLFSAFPTFALIRALVRRRLRRRRGVCLKCGYDLTSNVSGVCPECGKAIKTQ